MAFDHVDPRHCRIWPRHARRAEALTPENCADLIDAIRDGGQTAPAIVRPTGDSDRPLEVVAGVRRHFAVSWLRGNGHPDLPLAVEARVLDDEAAFRLGDGENRARRDLTDYERARDYLDALDRYYGGSQKEMAARLGVSRPWLTRLLQLAQLPAAVVGAFRAPEEVTLNHARLLRPLLRDEKKAALVLNDAASIRAERRLGCHGRMDGDGTVKRLQAAADPAAFYRPTSWRFAFRPDNPGITVTRQGRKMRVQFDETIDTFELRQSFDLFLQKRSACR